MIFYQLNTLSIRQFCRRKFCCQDIEMVFHRLCYSSFCDRNIGKITVLEDLLLVEFSVVLWSNYTKNECTERSGANQIRGSCAAKILKFDRIKLVFHRLYYLYFTVGMPKKQLTRRFGVTRIYGRFAKQQVEKHH